jgi:hypothetical protein
MVGEAFRIRRGQIRLYLLLHLKSKKSLGCVTSNELTSNKLLAMIYLVDYNFLVFLKIFQQMTINPGI